MRIQFVPFPAMKPLQPSSLHIFASALGTDILYSLRPTLCTWKRIFRRSSGDTTVRETAPATPPATKDARTGWAKVWRMRSRAVRSGARGYNDQVNTSTAGRCSPYVHSPLDLSGCSWLRRSALSAIRSLQRLEAFQRAQNRRHSHAARTGTRLSERKGDGGAQWRYHR
jgi:hypothetical protein